jgi:Nse-like zinc-finger protein/ankyrin repeat protein
MHNQGISGSRQTNMPMTRITQPEEIKFSEVVKCVELICPITQKYFEDPCQLLPCGHNFEWKAIVNWYSTNKQKICPICSVPFTFMLDNSFLKGIVLSYSTKIGNPNRHLPIQAVVTDAAISVNPSPPKKTTIIILDDEPTTLPNEKKRPLDNAALPETKHPRIDLAVAETVDASPRENNSSISEAVEEDELSTPVNTSKVTNSSNPIQDYLTDVESFISRIKRRYKDIKKMIKPANANDTDEEGNTILHLIILNYKRTDNIITKLLRCGANINAQNRSGETPLHIAAKINKQPAIDLLLVAGAKSIKDKAGKFPYDYAQNNKMSEALKTASNKDIYQHIKE